MFNYLRCRSANVSTGCITRQLAKRKSWMTIFVVSVLAITLLHLRKPTDAAFFNSQKYKNRPREFIINPGMEANLTRFYELNDFSNKDYIGISDIQQQTLERKVKEHFNSSKFVHSAGDSDRKIQQTECNQTQCNNGVCFENMLCYSLPTLLPNFKNPCFYEKVSRDDSDQNVYKNYIIRRMVPNVEIPAVQTFHRNWQARRSVSDTQLRCLPYFFIIGMEKCGTTDLYQRINMHPEIALSMAKELQWWTRRRFFYEKNNFFPGKLQSDVFKLRHVSSLVNVPFNHYYAFFDNVADQINGAIENNTNGTSYHRTITGDGSPNTMYWNDFRSIFNLSENNQRTLVAHHIAATLPQARIIAILRNPVDRLYSSYLFFNRDAEANDFHHIVSRGIKLFNRCVSIKSLPDCVYDYELKENIGSTVNIMQGIYSIMLEDWLQVFPASQVHVVHFESYKKSELPSINEVFKFLGVAPVSIHDHTGQRIITKKKVLEGKQYEFVGPMLTKTRVLLNAFYEPFNKELAKLLKDDRYLWKV